MGNAVGEGIATNMTGFGAAHARGALNLLGALVGALNVMFSHFVCPNLCPDQELVT